MNVYIAQFNSRRSRRITTLTENDGSRYDITPTRPYMRKELDNEGSLKIPGRYGGLQELKDTFSRELENGFILELIKED